MLPRNGGEPLVPSGSSDLQDSLNYNPFAGHSESSFSSAVKLSDGRAAARPVYRRRGSESTAWRDREHHIPIDVDEDEAYPGSNPRSHVRSMTESKAGGTSSSSADIHPLATRASSSNTSRSGQNTARPRLSRKANSHEPFHSKFGDSSVLHSSPPPDRGPEEKIVIVHQVAPKDSLAGVALKYGITLADLRRANQMWASDSIHLRKVLYIPLDKSHRAKEIMILLSQRSDSEIETEWIPTSAGSGSHGPGLVERRFPEHNLTIRRIPASHLSFFPTTSDAALDNTSSFLSLPRSNPEARRASSQNGSPEGLPSSVPPATGMYATHSSWASSEGSPSTGTQIRTHLASLFNALPIAPSTRETLLSRLSLESGASTPSQCSEEQDHELEDVSKMRRSSPNMGVRYLSESDSRYLKADPLPNRHTLDGPNLVELQPVQPSKLTPRRLSRSAVPQGSQTPHAVNHSTRTGYLSPDSRQLNPEVVRTAQLEPTPVMTLPLKGREQNDKG